MNRSIDYGLDAPGIRNGMIGVALGGVFVFLGFLIAPQFLRSTSQIAFRSGLIIGGVMLLYGLWMASYMTWSSRTGKVRTCDRLLTRAGRMRQWQGSEMVVDVGCGRGLMLIGAAKRLSTGKAIGFDLWRAEDQSGNSRDAAIANASAAGVADRVEVRTGDARDIPLASESVDVITSHWVLHNIDIDSERAKALDEMWRVVKPGGIIVLADINHVGAYLKHFVELGAVSSEFLDGGKEALFMGLLSGGTYRPQAVIS